METKFKHNDKVRIISNPLIVGELTDIIPQGIVNGVPFYSYKMHTINHGFLLVAENNLELVGEKGEEEK